MHSGTFQEVDAKGEEVTATVNAILKVSVVTKVEDARGADYLLPLVDQIPLQNTSEGWLKPAGLASRGGAVALVERVSGRYMNTVITHELGHDLGLDHSPNTIMSRTADTNPDNNYLTTNRSQLSGFGI
jgi:hypothetical protein